MPPAPISFPFSPIGGIPEERSIAFTCRLRAITASRSGCSEFRKSLLTRSAPRSRVYAFWSDRFWKKENSTLPPPMSKRTPLCAGSVNTAPRNPNSASCAPEMISSSMPVFARTLLTTSSPFVASRIAEVATARMVSTLDALATVAKSSIRRESSDTADWSNRPSFALRLAKRKRALTSDMTLRS